MAVKQLKIVMTSGLLAVSSAAMVAAQSPLTSLVTPCSQPEYKQFDFWVGDWDLSWTNSDGTVSTGQNIISKIPYENCVITENFDGSPAIPFKGMSVSTYSKPHEKWRQTWVDNSGGYFALNGGPEEDSTFVLTTERLGDKGPHSRMVF